MKKKSNKNAGSKRKIIALIIVFVLVAGLLTIGFVSTTVTSSVYANQLEGVYQRSFYELVTNINDLEVNLSKSLISSSKSAQEKNFYNIWQQCDLCSSNLSRLPILHNSINETTKFVNQLGGFSYYLLEKVRNNEEITEEDYVSLNDLHTTCLYIQKIINDYAEGLAYNYNILKDVSYNTDKGSFSATFTSMQSADVEYATLIYDGPFSDSVMNKQVKGLKEIDYSVDEAEDIIREGFSDYSIESLNYLGETNGKFETYNFQLTSTHGKDIYIQITKKGGMALTISSYANTTAKNMALSECEVEAETFASALGFENVKAVWSTSIGNIAYINLTTVIDDVVIYPEMIKVKIAMDTGEIVGWEASAYAYNHTQRQIETPTLTASQAQNKVSDKLNVLSHRLSIIPLDYAKEKMCYEYKCELNNYTYYVYINALTGEEENVLRVIETTNGQLLM